VQNLVDEIGQAAEKVEEARSGACGLENRLSGQRGAYEASSVAAEKLVGRDCPITIHRPLRAQLFLGPAGCA
jgi:hypothetical protein